MVVMCPRHHTELNVCREEVIISQYIFPLTVGNCPACKVKYVNKIPFGSGPSFSAGGVRYEFLQELANAFPYDAQQETTLEERHRAQEEQERQLLKLRREEEARRLQEEKQRKKREAEDRRINLLREQLQNAPSLPFYYKSMSMLQHKITHCPYDGEELMMLNNVRNKSTPKEAELPGLCCIRCNRLFCILPKGKAKKKKQDSLGQPPSSKSTKKLPPVPPLPKQPPKKKPEPIFNSLDAKLPKSTIMTVDIRSSASSGVIAIVADAAEQNSSVGIYWVGRSLSAMALVAIQTKQMEFVYKGQHCQVHKYTKHKDADKYLEIISRFYSTEEPISIFVFAQKNIAHYEAENYEMVTAMIPCKKSNFPVPISVYYNKERHQYFMNEVTYTQMRDRYGLPYLRVRFAPGEARDRSFNTLNPRSELNLNGYNVNAQNGMSRQQRQQRLRDIVDNKILYKHEITSHLEWLINTRTGAPNMEDAVPEWKADLDFLMNYQITKQQPFWASSVASRYSGVKPLG